MMIKQKKIVFVVLALLCSSFFATVLASNQQGTVIDTGATFIQRIQGTTKYLYIYNKSTKKQFVPLTYANGVPYGCPTLNATRAKWKVSSIGRQNPNNATYLSNNVTNGTSINISCGCKDVRYLTTTPSVPNLRTDILYNNQSPVVGDTCVAHEKSVTCNNGVLNNRSAGYIYTNCTEPPKQVSCGGTIPNGAVTNTPGSKYTFTQTNGVPVSMAWGYSTTQGECKYKCGSNYTWSNNTCKSAEGGTSPYYWVLDYDSLKVQNKQLSCANANLPCNSSGYDYPYRAEDWLCKSSVSPNGTYTYSTCLAELGRPPIIKCLPTPCNTCFVAGTKILLANGKSINIEDVKEGDILLGSNNSKNKVEHRYVLNNKGKIYSFNGGKYFVTATHPFYTSGGWKAIYPEGARLENPGLEVGKLIVGDYLNTYDGYILLSSISSKETNEIVYNFRLDGTKDYYADGYLVHNAQSK